jgi:hypothetical protein
VQWLYDFGLQAVPYRLKVLMIMNITINVIKINQQKHNRITIQGKRIKRRLRWSPNRNIAVFYKQDTPPE